MCSFLFLVQYEKRNKIPRSSRVLLWVTLHLLHDSRVTWLCRVSWFMLLCQQTHTKYTTWGLLEKKLNRRKFHTELPTWYPERFSTNFCNSVQSLNHSLFISALFIFTYSTYYYIFNYITSSSIKRARALQCKYSGILYLMWVEINHFSPIHNSHSHSLMASTGCN